MTKSKGIFKRIISLLGIILVLCFLAVLIIIHIAFPSKYSTVVSESAEKYSLDESLIRAVIWTESKYDRKAKSSKGAIGLMQLLPSTAAYIAKSAGYEQITEEMLFDAEVNIELGSCYLRYLFNRFEDEETVVAAYNAGEGNVIEWQKNDLTTIPFKETREYVKRVAIAKKIYDFKSK